MTIIAYKSGIIACDSIITANSTKWGNIKKITKNSMGWLAGAAGDASFVSEFLDWVNAIPEIGANNKISLSLFGKYKTKDNEAILILPYDSGDKKEKILLFETNYPVEITDSYTAIGSGVDCALGAMYCNASAIKAVESAIEHCSTCDGTIYWEELRRI